MLSTSFAVTLLSQIVAANLITEDGKFKVINTKTASLDCVDHKSFRTLTFESCGSYNLALWEKVKGIVKTGICKHFRYCKNRLSG